MLKINSPFDVEAIAGIPGEFEEKAIELAVGAADLVRYTSTKRSSKISPFPAPLHCAVNVSPVFKLNVVFEVNAVPR